MTWDEMQRQLEVFKPEESALYAALAKLGERKQAIRERYAAIHCGIKVGDRVRLTGGFHDRGTVVNVGVLGPDKFEVAVKCDKRQPADNQCYCTTSSNNVELISEVQIT